jgi:diaminopimelate epimerase
MKYRVVIADPAKNITAFVLDAVQGREERAALANEIMADPALKVEQVGFVIPPSGFGAASAPASCSGGLWRLEMMGGEFCGNAARSFGLYAARRMGLKGNVTIPVSVSGAAAPVSVELDVEAGQAAVAIGGPVSEYLFEYEGPPARGKSLFQVYVFEGITHVIAPGIMPSKETFYLIKKALEQKAADAGAAFSGQKAAPEGAASAKPASLPGALGVLFYDSAPAFMTPAVYVYATGSLVFESSCGSGSAALGCWLSRNLLDGQWRGEVKQPGGNIEVRVRKESGIIGGISIGGFVDISSEFVE